MLHGIVKRRGRTALSVAALGILFPLLGGFLIVMFRKERKGVPTAMTGRAG